MSAVSEDNAQCKRKRLRIPDPRYARVDGGIIVLNLVTVLLYAKSTQCSALEWHIQNILGRKKRHMYQNVADGIVPRAGYSLVGPVLARVGSRALVALDLCL